MLQALGLLRPGVDLTKVVADADREGTLGFYSSEDKELVVRRGEATPLLRQTIVHELTHALDDQHFGIRRDFESDEAATGWDSLVEGSAVRIERRYVESLPASEQEAIEAAEEAQLARRGEVPPVVELSLGFPYVFGPELVEELLRQGGQARLDAAFSSPPRSSEQVIEPVRYLRGDEPREGPPPTADGAVLDQGEIGQVLLTLVLQSQLDEAVAREAAAGWGGDGYVAWKKDMSTCVRVAFVMDTPSDAQQLESALSEWGRRRQGSVVSGGSLTPVVSPGPPCGTAIRDLYQRGFGRLLFLGPYRPEPSGPGWASSQDRCSQKGSRRMPHGETWLVANGDDGNKYWAYCRKYSDAHETAFKAKVKEASGYPCRRVHRENSEPSSGIEIEL